MGCPSTLSPLWMMLPFASRTAADLQRMFDTVTVFGGRMGFHSMRQSGVVICGPLRRRQQIIEGSFVWRMAADTVPVVTICKHLGVAGCARSATRSRGAGGGKRQVTGLFQRETRVSANVTIANRRFVFSLCASALLEASLLCVATLPCTACVLDFIPVFSFPCLCRLGFPFWPPSMTKRAWPRAGAAVVDISFRCSSRLILACLVVSLAAAFDSCGLD